MGNDILDAPSRQCCIPFQLTKSSRNGRKAHCYIHGGGKCPTEGLAPVSEQEHCLAEQLPFDCTFVDDNFTLLQETALLARPGMVNKYGMQRGVRKDSRLEHDCFWS